MKNSEAWKEEEREKRQAKQEQIRNSELMEIVKEMSMKIVWHNMITHLIFGLEKYEG